jgi:glycosyltransferase involved in cell wall biosynthesis
VSARKLCFIVESGTDVRLVDGLAGRTRLTVVAREIPGGVPISRTPASGAEVRIGPASRLAFARFAARAVREDAYDAILVQGYGLAALRVGITALRRRIPAINLVCSPSERYYRCRRDNPVPGMPYRGAVHLGMRLAARANAAIAQRYVVLSEYLSEVVRNHGVRAPIDVVPVYGVDTARFRPTDEPRSAIRRRLGLAEAGPLLFFSSRVAPEKDTETLLRALALLCADGRPVTVLHRSGGWRAFTELAAALGVGDLVIATDAVHPEHELPDSYRAADLCVQASMDEGLGFSPLEALACGTPVIATAVGGLRETVLDGRTGWSVPPRAPRALADAIADALARPDEGARRAAEGRRMVAERFERSLVFERLFAIPELRQG